MNKILVVVPRILNPSSCKIMGLVGYRLNMLNIFRNKKYIFEKLDLVEFELNFVKKKGFS